MTITARERARLREMAERDGGASSVRHWMILALLDALDAAEQRAAPLVWRRIGTEEIAALPDESKHWVREAWRRRGRVTRGKWIKAHADYFEQNGWRIAGPIPEPVEGERT